MSCERDPETFEEAFHEKRTKLIYKMETGVDFMSLLEDRNIITSVHRQSVEATDGQHGQVSKLLDILLRCDDAKLPLFIESLKATNQEHVVEIILRRKIGKNEFVMRRLSSHDTRQSTKMSCSGDQNEAAKLTRRKRRSSPSNELPSQRTALDICINTRAATAAAAAENECSPKRVSPKADRSPIIVGTPLKANSPEPDDGARVESSTFSLKDLQQLIGKKQTPQLIAKLESISEPKRPHDVRSPASEFFVMYISDGETRARTVVFDRRHLYQDCMDVVGKSIAIQAGSYTVHRNSNRSKYQEPIYISLDEAPILHDDPNNNPQ